MIFAYFETGVLLVWSILLVLLVACVLVGMTSRRRDAPLCRLASEHRAWVILIVIGVGLFLGTIGDFEFPVAKYGVQGQGWFGRLTDAFYDSVLQLTLNGEVQPDDSLFKRMARLAGLATIILLAYEAIQLLFAKPLQQFWLDRQRGHIVICGLGRVGRALISDLTNSAQNNALPVRPRNILHGTPKMRAKRLVVIERDKDNPDIPWVESRGVSVVIGNATDEEVLVQVGAHRASDIFFAVGSDELNLESAYDSMRIINEQSKNAPLPLKTSPPRLFVHLRNPRLESMLVQAKMRALESHDEPTSHFVNNLIVQPFNVIDRSIQALLDGPALDRRPVQESEVAHFVIVGFGEVGQELAVKIAQLAHYENLKRSRMTIVYSRCDIHAVEQFQELYPKFFPNLDTFEYELNAKGLKANDYDVWMPFKELDDWSFGVTIATRQVPGPDDPDTPMQVIDAPSSRGIEFAVNGGFALAEGGVTCNQFLLSMETLSRTQGIRPMVFICHAQDEQNCADAKELRDELDIRLKVNRGENQATYVDTHDHRITIFPYVPNRPMLHSLIEPQNKLSADLIPWGDCRKACTHRAITTDIFRPLAVVISHDYDLKYAQKEAASKGETVPTRGKIAVKSLEAMVAWQRHSNLMAAAHVNVKLAPLGLMLRPITEGGEYPQPDNDRIQSIIDRSIHHSLYKQWFMETADDRLLEVAAKMEHHRWIAERLLMDWGFGAKGDKGSPESKKRLAFVDWANLPESEGVKDRDQMARILELCKDEASRPVEKRRFVLTASDDRS